MLAVVLRHFATPVAPNIDVIDDWPDPQPGPGEVVVRTEASSLNHLDLWVGRGLPGMEPPLPHIGGSDGAGRVEAVGEGVDKAWVGRRVLLNAAIVQQRAPLPETDPCGPELRMIGEHSPGTLAERFTAPVANVLDIGQVDPIAGAAFGLTYLTAWRMLITRAGVQPGRQVLITGIGGGVALAALDLCRHLGCRTIVTSRHDWKLQRARERGAGETILDTGEGFARQVRAATGGRGVDVCVDSVGQAIHLSCIKSLARGGVFVTCGCTTGSETVTELARLFWNQLTFVGSTMGDMDEFRQVTALLKSGALHPEIDTVYQPHDARAAYQRLESGEQFGKLVIDWGRPGD